MGRIRQKNLSAFVDFKLDVIDISKANIKSIDYKDRKDGVITKTAIDLTKNTLMQENVKQRLELPREIGNINPFVNSKSMSQLCSDKKGKKEAVKLYRFF